MNKIPSTPQDMSLISSQMNEVFWKVLELSLDKYQFTLELRGSRLNEIAHLYAPAIHDAGTM